MIDIGSRRELFIDDYLIERMDGCSLVLHQPKAEAVAIVHDEPWEGNTSYYHTVFRDGDRIRMFYRGTHCIEEEKDYRPDKYTCYAESVDGIHFEKPELGIVEYKGAKKNNIILTGDDSTHDFIAFKDENPNCDPAEAYKGIDTKNYKGLLYFVSPDGIHWSLKTSDPIITEGKFDSQNLAFWDSERKTYVEYHRASRNKIRDIMTGTSSDFLTWTKPEWLEYPDAPVEHLYTNQIIPYFRAPHIYFGFPMRFVPGRNPADHFGNGVSDAIFMTSRDGRTFKRWTEALIRPGLQECRWVNRNNFVAWGIVETESSQPDTPNEISIYCGEAYHRGEASRMRRYSSRLDGFVSIQAPLSGGEVVTKEIVFAGDHIELNVSTSAAGKIELEILDRDSRRIAGFGADDFGEIYGDSVNLRLEPQNRGVAELAGTPVRLRFRLSDADLFAIRFA